MKGRSATPETVHQHLAWAYANLARADAALKKGDTKYGTVHHIIRAKLYKGLLTGSMSLGSLLDDERLKLIRSPSCSYCGCEENLAIDHLMPKAKAGADRPENFVLACRSCNSSKRDRDCVAWFVAKGEFPPLMLLRRYLKLAFSISTESEWLNLSLEDLATLKPPFDPANFPLHFPDLSTLKL